MVTRLHDHYVRSSNRLLLLDYDGTLVGFTQLPEHAKPSSQLRQLLAALAGDPRNTVVIVSGRDRQFLDRELGQLRLPMVAEHGFFIKPAATWQAMGALGVDWKPVIRPLMQRAAGSHRGAQVEDKATALAWHFRRLGQEGEQLADELQSRLVPHLAPLGLVAVRGHKVLEVRPAGVHKGLAAQYWLGLAAWDFILAAGDDVTDEDLFAAVPADAHTFRVGSGPSTAGQRLANPAALADLLARLSAASR